MNKVIISVLTACFVVVSSISVNGFFTHDNTISRTFNKENAVVGESITVTVRFGNLEVNDMRGFYYTEQIPLNLSVSTVSVKINGSNISYTAESGLNGEIYADYIPYCWVLELPPSFGETNPVSQDFTVEIVYTVTASNTGTFSFNEFSWVGYYPTAAEGERAAFGHGEEEDKQTLYFYATPDFDYDDDGDIDNLDLSTFASGFGGNVDDLSAFIAVFGQ